MQQFLTPYEMEQVDHISSWLSERPSVVETFVDRVTAPIAWISSHFTIDLGLVNVPRMARLAALNDGIAEISKAAGVADVIELKHHPLEECDALALQVSYHNERLALVEGAGFSVLGSLNPIVSFMAELGDEAVELISAMRSITRIGHCYGYRLNRPQDLAIIECVLEVAMILDPVRRAARVKTLHEALDGKLVLTPVEEAHTAEEAVEKITGEASIAQMAADELVEGPFAVVFDYHFERQVDIAARRIFQERWLRDNGKVKRVPPAPASHRRSSAREVYDAGGQTAFIGGGFLGFVVCLPVALVGRLFRLSNNLAVRGCRDGSDQARATVRRWPGAAKTKAVGAKPAVATATV